MTRKEYVKRIEVLTSAIEQVKNMENNLLQKGMYNEFARDKTLEVLCFIRNCIRYEHGIPTQ